MLFLALFVAATHASTEACLSKDRRRCFDDVNWNANGFSLTHDLREGCCTSNVGYAGAGATYHDGVSCKMLGFDSSGIRVKASLSEPQYSQRMCSLSGVDCEEHPEYENCVDVPNLDAIKGIAKGLGLRASCGGMEVFASCQQELHVYSKQYATYLQYEKVAGDTSCKEQGMDMITNQDECTKASIFLGYGSDVWPIDHRFFNNYKIPRGCFINEPLQSYTDSNGNIKSYSPKNELNHDDGLGYRKSYFTNPADKYWKDDSHGTNDCNTFPCICRRGTEQECKANSPLAGIDGKCGPRNGDKKCSIYVNPKYKRCSNEGWCGETPGHVATLDYFRGYDDSSIPDMCRPEKHDGCGMYRIKYNVEGGCDWSGTDKAGRRSVGGMGNDHECNQACKRLGKNCKYAAYKFAGGTGYCHLFKTCTGSEGGSGWKTFEKRCQTVAAGDMEAVVEDWLQENDWKSDVVTYGFASIGLVVVLYGAGKYYGNRKTHSPIPSTTEEEF